MAAAVPVIAKVVIGAVVSKVVTKMTGNSLVGAIAGMGVGGLMGPEGLMSGAEAAGAAGETAAQLGPVAAETVYGGSQVLDMSGGTEGLLGSYGQSAVPMAETAATTVASSAPSATQAISESAKPGGGLLSSAGDLMTKAEDWMTKHPGLVETGSKVLGGVAQSMEAQEQRDWEEEQLKEGRDWRSKEAEREYERTHQTVDPSQVRSLSDVNQSLAQGGYQSQYQRLMDQGPQAQRTGPVLPNYKLMLERLRGERNG